MRPEAGAWTWRELPQNGKLAWVYFYATGYLEAQHLTVPTELYDEMQRYFVEWQGEMESEELEAHALGEEVVRRLRSQPRTPLEAIPKEARIEPTELPALMASWQSVPDDEQLLALYRLAVMHLATKGSVLTGLIEQTLSIYDLVAMLEDKKR
jgi:hypothetical protein